MPAADRVQRAGGDEHARRRPRRAARCSAASISSASWRSTQPRTVAGSSRLARADVDGRAGLGLEDDPRLGLAEAQAEVLAGERAAGVEVDRQALAGVEQLDQQRGVGAVALDVVGAEEALGVGRDRVAQQAAVLEPAQPLGVGAERRRGRADPVLRPAVLALGDAAQRVDARAAAVEAVELVGREQQGLHGRPLRSRGRSARSGR